MSTLPLYMDIGSLSVYHFSNIFTQSIKRDSRTILHLCIKRGCPPIAIVNVTKAFPIYPPPIHGESLCIHLHIDQDFPAVRHLCRDRDSPPALHQCTDRDFRSMILTCLYTWMDR